MKENLSTTGAGPHKELWSRLTARQQAEVAAMFRYLKREAQMVLCYMLMDYMERGKVPLFREGDMVLSAVFVYLTGYGLAVQEPWCIEPKKAEE